MQKVKIIETYIEAEGDKPVEKTHEVEMWSVDAREACRIDPARFRPTQPEAVADNSPAGLAEQLAAMKKELDALKKKPASPQK